MGANSVVTPCYNALHVTLHDIRKSIRKECVIAWNRKKVLVFPSHLVASMVLGIVAICLSCFWYIAISCAIVGLVLSIVSIAVTIIVVVALGATIASLL